MIIDKVKKSIEQIKNYLLVFEQKSSKIKFKDWIIDIWPVIKTFETELKLKFEPQFDKDVNFFTNRFLN